MCAAFLGGGRLALVVWAVLSGTSAGCTRAELEHKTDAYNQAIAESNNRQILLNAVRASQRAPMSFVGFGDVSATPNWSGAANGGLNFDPFGLTTYNVNPSVNVNGGFNSFTMNNLNTKEFAAQLQHRLTQADIQHFVDLRFPEELVYLLAVQEYTVPQSQFERIELEASRRCQSPSNPRSQQFCMQFSVDAERLRTCPSFPPSQTVRRLNTGRDLCGMTAFQLFQRQLRFLEIKLPFVARTGQGVLYYLGELIAAQNYSPYPFMPELFTATADGVRRTVPLFEVKRGISSDAVVAVNYQGEGYYIPRPAFGALEEARSLQVLDLVSQLLTRATAAQALPRTSTVTLVPSR